MMDTDYFRLLSNFKSKLIYSFGSCVIYLT